MAAGARPVSRQPDFSTAARSRSLRTWDRIALAAGVLAVGLVALAAQRARGEAAEAGARLAQAQAELQRLEARRATLAVRRTTGGADTSSSPARVVAAIAAALPADARLERLAIDYSRGVAIEMQVVTRSPAAWDRLLERLERSPELREVAPGPESRAGEVHSVVHARWAGGAR
jgi:Tfp pilus assembly protein PilN